MSSVYDWSTTAGSNSNSDSGINWAEGQLPGTVNGSARAMMGRIAELVKDIGGALVAGGTANALTVTANSAFTTNVNGRFIAFRAASDNTAAATLNVNSIGAKSIRKMTASGDVALSGAEIQASGIYMVQYSEALNAAAGGWLLLNPTPADQSAYVTLTGTQTLTNKTLTSPTINTPTLTGGTSASMTLTGAAMNGTLGATTPSTVAGTTGTFSGTLTTVGADANIGGSVQSGQNFYSSTTTAVLATTGAGTVILRPNGVGSTVNQMTYSSGGNLVAAGTIAATGGVSGTTGTFSGAVSGTTGTFSSSVTGSFVIASANVFANSAAATMNLRPNGSGSATGQVTIATNGAVTINGTLTVTG